MRQLYRLFLALALIFSLAGCADFFENSSDAQARKALMDLIDIQNKFHKQNKRYAKNLVEIQDYNLKYHSGIVYLEIESADANGYRAISLPAESTTARVFAHDSKQGGFYEMDEVEVSHYVLGSLSGIRAEQRDKFLVDLSGYVLIGAMFILGTRFLGTYREKKHLAVYVSFFTSLLALGWALSSLHHLNPDVVFTQTLITLTVAASVAVVASAVIALTYLLGRNLSQTPAALIGLLATSLILSTFSGAVLALSFVKYY
jgi:hypothetical protein